MKKISKIAYFDCSSGISGDMCLGAIVDSGVLLGEIAEALKHLPVQGYTLSEKKVKRAGISATKVDVIVSPSSGSSPSNSKKWKNIRDIVKKSRFPDDIKEKALSIFKILFEAEAKVHGKPAHKVHLHELSGIDCLVDVFGTLAGLSLLGVEKVYASPINTGSGSVMSGHGVLPVPAPATSEILRGVTVYSSGIHFELTTPTGAAIVKSLSSGFGEIPFFTPERIGCGAGTMNFDGKPNILRIFTGNAYSGLTGDTITVIETNIDDMNPQIYDYLFEKLLHNGALDVFLTTIMMKKNRPGIKLTVLSSTDRRNDLIGILLKETTTIGVRYYETSRITLDREFRTAKTRFGNVRLKITRSGKLFSKSSPEFEDCRKIAENKNIPLLEVIEEAKRHSKRKSS